MNNLILSILSIMLSCVAICLSLDEYNIDTKKNKKGNDSCITSFYPNYNFCNETNKKGTK